MDRPVFAVVGHPNKGKSSIVATLAHNDAVAIARISGTTQRCEEFPMRVDGEELYRLIDTPGFQRARRLLAWLRANCDGVEGRPAAVRAFVEEHREGSRFRDECELLAPIINGAGIIYVVDGSRPYGPEYEAEMEILRWTGRPSMALINPICDESHVDSWRTALGQYFGMVRVFNAMTARFHQQINLLIAFGELQESWRPVMRRAVDLLNSDRQRRHQRAALAIAHTLAEMLSYEMAERMGEGEERALRERRLLERFLDQLRRREEEGRRRVEQTYDHGGLDRQELVLELLDQDLFEMRNWYLWGLSRRELVALATGGGAATGAAIDAGVGGASLMLGAVAGGVVSVGATLLFADRIARVRLRGLLPLGGRDLVCGPVSNRNFPWVVLGRALHHQWLVASRTHARRDRLVLEREGVEAQLIDWGRLFGRDERSELERSFRRLRNSGGDQKRIVALAELIENHLRRVDDEASERQWVDQA